MNIVAAATPISALGLSALLLAFASMMLGLAATPGGRAVDEPHHNKQIIQQAFEEWRPGTGGPFALLASDASRTIAGNSLAGKRYATRQEFLDQVIAPFNARMTTPLVPTVHGLYADRDTVVALFDAEATAAGGVPDRNIDAWFVEMKGAESSTLSRSSMPSRSMNSRDVSSRKGPVIAGQRKGKPCEQRECTV